MDFTILEKNIKLLVMLEHTMLTGAVVAMGEAARSEISAFKAEFSKRVPAEKREIALAALESDIKRFEACAQRQWA